MKAKGKRQRLHMTKGLRLRKAEGGRRKAKGKNQSPFPVFYRENLKNYVNGIGRPSK
jgi:hypothetical protein